MCFISLLRKGLLARGQGMPCRVWIGKREDHDRQPRTLQTKTESSKPNNWGQTRFETGHIGREEYRGNILGCLLLVLPPVLSPTRRIGTIRRKQRAESSGVYPATAPLGGIPLRVVSNTPASRAAMMQDGCFGFSYIGVAPHMPRIDGSAVHPQE